MKKIIVIGLLLPLTIERKYRWVREAIPVGYYDVLGWDKILDVTMVKDYYYEINVITLMLIVLLGIAYWKYRR